MAVHRLLAALALSACVAAGCGGGGGSEDPTETVAPSSTASGTGDVAGVRTQTPTTPEASATPPGTYEVVAGDTLFDIAARFGTTVDALVALNELASADELQIGQVLKIADGAAGTATTVTQ